MQRSSEALVWGKADSLPPESEVPAMDRAGAPSGEALPAG
jgi:hypothetical protein